MTMSALTPTTTPPIAITLMSDSSFEPRRLRRYRQAIAELEPRSFGAHRRKEDHVADVRVSVRYMNSRSMPMPTPPIGGMPYSIARR